MSVTIEGPPRKAATKLTKAQIAALKSPDAPLVSEELQALKDEGLAPRKSRAKALREPDGKIEIPKLTKGEVETLKAGVALIKVSRPKLRQAVIHIQGLAGSPYVQHAFSAKAQEQMEQTQRMGQQARGRRTREAKNFEAVYEAAKHYAQGKKWIGIPAPAFRNACIDACRLCGIRMTHAKLSIFVEADGIDENDGTPLVRIIGKERVHKGFVRNDNGSADLRWRPLWETWKAAVKVTWDEDQFSANDVVNLMLRAGLQVGIGEGRPNSPNSNGLGWGRFEVVE